MGPVSAHHWHMIERSAESGVICVSVGGS